MAPVGEIPFASESKRMTTLHAVDGAVMAYAKGAPEVILPCWARQISQTGEHALSGQEKDAIS